MKNILTKYAATRSAFSLTADRVAHHVGLPVANPYIGNRYRFLGQHDAVTRKVKGAGKWTGSGKPTSLCVSYY